MAERSWVLARIVEDTRHAVHPDPQTPTKKKVGVWGVRGEGGGVASPSSPGFYLGEGLGEGAPSPSSDQPGRACAP